MQTKFLAYGLVALWLVLFVTSFVVVRAVGPEDDDYVRRLSRIASFLTWQLAALVVAAVSAFAPIAVLISSVLVSVLTIAVLLAPLTPIIVAVPVATYTSRFFLNGAP